MKVKWEHNSRVKSMAENKIIDAEDIIPRTQTDKFPHTAATVRLKDVQSIKPWVTIHIRGKGISKTNSWNNYTWTHATTMRVHFGHEYHDYSVNGELHGDIGFEEVEQVVKEVKRAMNASIANQSVSSTF